MRRDQASGAVIALAALAPAWWLARKLKHAWDLAHLPVIVLHGSDGLEVHIRPLGCAIQRLLAPDNEGNVDDIVLGFDDVGAYAADSSPYFGVVVGRCANRIKEGSFSLEGKKYQLATNNPPNALHGGQRGFDKRIFAFRQYTTPEGDEAVVLSRTSKDGEEGYPGTLQVSVTYTLQKPSTLKMFIEAATDKTTPVNMAQHSYFNLAGHSSGDILGHRLHINGEHYTPKDATSIPTGDSEPVKDTPFDFRQERRIGEAISTLADGFDHNYVLFGKGRHAKFTTSTHANSSPQLAAELFEPRSGRQMKVLTTAPGLQFYSGNFLDGSLTGKGGIAYERHAGLCLETQGFPNAVNESRFPSVLLKPGEKYIHETHYVFTTQ
ncbi:hypothetical protein WJX73_010775 [Symbiochloris irregularis]|uniref:Aldose 1-epimerase n=1 Tax=Symbiochloris irregularis TaxID=706552 RepID=A0AAW1P8R5_9CHLO